MDISKMTKVVKRLKDAAKAISEHYDDLEVALLGEDWNQVVCSIEDIQMSEELSEIEDLKEMKKAAEKLY